MWHPGRMAKPLQALPGPREDQQPPSVLCLHTLLTAANWRAYKQNADACECWLAGTEKVAATVCSNQGNM